MTDYTSEAAKRLSPIKSVPTYTPKVIFSDNGLMPVIGQVDEMKGDLSAYMPAPNQHGVRLDQQFSSLGLIMQILPDYKTENGLPTWLSLLNYFGGTRIEDSGITPWNWYGTGPGTKGIKFADDEGWLLNPTGLAMRNMIAGLTPGSVGGMVETGPGQSYNPFTGQFDNPKLHPNDAAQLNRGAAYRRVTESGLSRAETASARDTSSVLASLTEQVIGSRLATATDDGLATVQRVTDIGLGQGGAKSILGTEKVAPKAKLKSVLASSSSF